jgi:small subunit ribosomal protein S4e
MVYLNRNNFGKFWPIARKGSKYVTRSSHNLGESVPLMVVMRDILKLVRTKKELKKLINEKQVKINGKLIQVVNYPICLFDVLSLEGLKKNYKMILSENKRFGFEEIADKDAKSRVYKVLNKKILSKGVVQLNLNNGKNILSKEKIGIGDGIVLDFAGKVLDVVKLKKGSNAVVIEGKHAGDKGKIEGVIERGGKKLVKIKLNDGSDVKSGSGESVNVWVKNVMVE